MAALKKKTLAIIDVTLQVNLLEQYLRDNGIKNIFLFYNETLKIKNSIIGNASKISKYKSFLSKIFILPRLIFGQYGKVILGSDLGLINNIFILVTNASLVILDDGNLSLYRRRIKFKCFTFFRRIYTNKAIEYYSIFPPAFDKQPGNFSIKLRDVAKKKERYSNKLFYISGANWIEGMSRSEELLLYKKLQAYAGKLGHELIILPHRKDKFNEYENFIYSKYILKTGKNFEEWYMGANFSECIFVTINSTAIYCVDKNHKRFYIKPSHNIKMGRTTFEKFIFAKRRSIETIWKVYRAHGIECLNEF